MSDHTTSKDTGTIAKQVVLPFRKSLEISIQSLRVRFFRSLITVMTLVLAVSFLSFMLVNENLVQGMIGCKDPQLCRMLMEAGYDVDMETMTGGNGAKERWIVILSLLVCTVGIINAQLMAVTERFREIGTMKCLGALDSFVLRLFLLEAGMQGIVGAFAGAVLGLVFALGLGLLRFGFPALTNASAADMGLSVLLAVGVGFLLSLLGVFYPAVIAARMQPVEAMRAQD